MDIKERIRNEREQKKNKIMFGRDLSDLKMKRCYERECYKGHFGNCKMEKVRKSLKSE